MRRTIIGAFFWVVALYGQAWQRPDPYNVKTRGAKGDGSDATAAIQATLDAAEAAGGGRVFAPAGVYLLSAHPLVASNVEFVGAGMGATIFRVKANSLPSGPPSTAWVSPHDPNSLTAIASKDGASAVRFADFTVDMNGANQTEKPFMFSISLSNASRSTIERVQVVNAYHRGAMVGLFGTGGTYNTVRDNRLIGPGVTNPTCTTNIGVGGIFVQNSKTLVEGNYATGMCDEAYIANGPGATDVVFAHNTVYQHFSQLTNAPSSFHAEDSSRTSFIGNSCIGFSACCFNAAPTGALGSNMTDIVMVGNTCAPDAGGNAPGLCYQAIGDGAGHTTRYVTIGNNLAHGAANTGIIVAARNVLVTGNLVRSGLNGVYVTVAALDSTIRDNVIVGNSANDLLIEGGVLPSGTVAHPNVLTGADSQITVGAVLRGSHLQNWTSVGANTGAAYSTISASQLNGLLRITTNLNPDDMATLFDAAKPGWGIDQSAAEDHWQLMRKPTGAGAATVPLKVTSAGVYLGGSTFAALGTPADGAVVYCSDCTIATPCAGSGTGALAKRLNGAWVCN